jgi:hypothetical protein
MPSLIFQGMESWAAMNMVGLTMRVSYVGGRLFWISQRKAAFNTEYGRRHVVLLALGTFHI